MIYWSIIFPVLEWIYKKRENTVYGTIDVNLSEFEYLAAHLDSFECRRLIAALHYDGYELPKNLPNAVRKISEEVPCLRQLLHWNMSKNEGRGRTHEDIEHRLRQLGRDDLADWLGRTAFKELGKDLFKSIDEPIERIIKPKIAATTDQTYTISTEAIDNSDEENIWFSIDMIAKTLFTVLLFTLVIVIGALIINKFASRYHKNKKISINVSNDENQKLLNE